MFLQEDSVAGLIFCFGTGTAEMQEWRWESGFRDERGWKVNLVWGIFLKYHPDGDKLEIQP